MITLFYNNFKMIKFRCYLYILGTLPSLLLAFIEKKWGCIIFSYLSRLMFLLRVQLFSSDYGRTTHIISFQMKLYILLSADKNNIRTSRSIRLFTDALLLNQRFYHNALMICYSGLT